MFRFKAILKLIMSYMKLIKGILSVSLIFALMLIYSCGDNGGGDEETQKEARTKILTKEGGWSMSSINVPAGTVFDGSEADWEAVGVTFTSTNMNSTNIPTDGEKVWPASASWTMNDEGTTITRGDGNGVEMTFVGNPSEDQVVFSFTLPEGTTIGRVQSLEGEYTVTLN
jgi:hypothetical protein